ncbi:MAG: dihydrolipoyl dehydrogenase [Spirochaetes bacterium]|nr:dihydrolipoyl dehydrogenase [Spirochaetota bacterium]
MNYDVIIIGSGPGGYTSACICAKNGLKTAIVEKDKIGGVCLNIGCIPTKALINLANNINNLKEDDIIKIDESNINIDREKASYKLKKIAKNVSKGVEFLFKHNKIDIINGNASFIDKNTIMVNDKQYTGEYIVIATGSSNKNFSSFINEKLMEKNKIIESTQALFLDYNPSSISILGGGAIGVEFAYIFNAFGVDVTIIEYLPNLLPNIDPECGKALERSFMKKKIKILTNTKVIKIEQINNSTMVFFNKQGKEASLSTDIVLCAMGRTPNTNIKGINNIPIEIENGYIKVNEWMQTSIPNIYAIGDVVCNSPMLAHVAYDEARTASEHILKKDNGFVIDYNLVPFCVYSEPQIASFGLTEKEANEKNIEFNSVKVFFKTSGKAQAIGKTEGFVKLIIDTKKEIILGAHICGAEATELIHELLVLTKAGLKLKQLADTMHAHPSLAETIAEAAKSYYGLALY